MVHLNSQDTPASVSQASLPPDAPLDLQQFCGHEESRPFLQRPFRFGAFSYASNGHILIRVDARDADAAPAPNPKGFEAKLEGIFARVHGFMFQPVDTKLPPIADCEACLDCDGEGHAHPCPACQCPCGACDGTGEWNPERRTSAEFGGALFALRYIRQVLSLPHVEIAIGSADSKQSAPLLFRFDGGHGALMPLCEPYSKHVDITKQEGEHAAAH